MQSIYNISLFPLSFLSQVFNIESVLSMHPSDHTRQACTFIPLELVHAYTGPLGWHGFPPSLVGRGPLKVRRLFPVSALSAANKQHRNSIDTNST